MLELLLSKFPFLQKVIFNNTILDYLLALLVFAASLIVLKIIKTIIIVRLKAFFKKTKTNVDDIVIDALDSIHWPFFVFVSIYVSLQFVNVPDIVSRLAYYIFMIALVYYAIRFVSSLINYASRIVIQKKEAEQQNAGIIRLIATVLKIGLWVGALLLILSNMGYNVTSLIAGLGIGGLAIGLALQNILGDLFSSLAIYFDKPFKVGDFVIVGQYMGTVKHVGVKTTRIEALQGEEIVMANSDLTNSRIQNFGIMKRRRIVFEFGVTYDTPASKLEQIPGWVKEIIDKPEITEYDRSHFKAFGDSSLNYENVYYINSGDYNEYMDVQQAINLSIVKKFEAEGVEMAFPTRTVYMKAESNH